MKLFLLILLATLNLSVYADETSLSFSPEALAARIDVKAIQQQLLQKTMSYGEFSKKFVMQIENRNLSLFTANELSHGAGTGFIAFFEKDPTTGKDIGIIFTNNHVIEKIPYSKRDLTLHFLGPKGTRENIKTKVIYQSLLDDLAFLQFDVDSLSKELQENLMPAILPDESSPFYDFDNNYTALQGKEGIALGNPLGTTNVTTFGQITGRQTSGSTGNLILTQTPINLGNSGGPMVTTDGIVVGINSAKRIGQDVDNMGFALPIAKAIEEYKAWRKDSSLSQATFIPMLVEPISTAALEVLGLKDLIEQEAPGYFSRNEGTLTVQDVLPGSVLQPGDKIFKLNGKECGPIFYNFKKEKFYSKGTLKVDLVRNKQILKNVEVPITNVNYRVQRSKLDIISLSGMLILEQSVRENYMSFGDTKNRVWIAGFIESNQTNLHKHSFPPNLSIISAIRVNGEFKEINSLRELKNIIKELPPGTKHLELRVQLPLVMSTDDGPVTAMGMAGGIMHQSHLRTFIVPLTHALMYPALNLNAFEKQFSLEEGAFESRDFHLFVARQQAACEAKLNGEAQTENMMSPISATQGPKTNAGATWGFWNIN